MPFCSQCNLKSTCKTICKELEKTLSKPTSGRLRGEHSFDPFYLEDLAGKKVFELKYGRKYFKGRRGQQGE